MSYNYFGAIGIDGGASGDMDDINHANLNDGDICVVVEATTNKLFVYTYSTSEAGAEELVTNTIIIPDSNSSGTGAWQLVTSQSASYALIQDWLAATNLSDALTAIGTKVEHMWIPIKAMTPLTTNGCAPADNSEFATNDVMKSYLAFDGATEEYADFDIVMPSTWDRSTIKFKAYWAPGDSACTAGDTVEWQLAGISVSDDGAIDDAYTDTGEVISDTVLAGKDGDLHISAKSPAVTINGSPALGDLINLRISRNVGGTDDMTEDAWLFGIVIEFSNTNTVAAW